MSSRKYSSDDNLPPPSPKQSPTPPPAAAVKSSAKKNVKKVKGKNPGDAAGTAQRVTSQPAVPTAAAAAATGDARASSAVQIVNVVRDTRQQISELRQRTEQALAQMQQANIERRQQLADIQAAKDHLNLLHEQIANIISYNFAAAAGTRSQVTPATPAATPAVLPDESEDSA